MSSRNPLTPWLPVTRVGKPATGGRAYPCAAAGAANASTPSSFHDVDPKGKSPLTAQQQPTESKPIRQRHRMAGYG